MAAAKKPSLLQRQLADHRAAHPLPAPADAKKRRPTLLFAEDPERANKLDARDVFDLGVNGFTELCALDPELQRFHSSLFTPAVGTDPNTERHLLPLSRQLQIDSTCSELLFELAPHLQSDACIKVLEYLIQRFQIHVSAPMDLLGVALLYHETPLFANVLRIQGLLLAPPWPSNLKHVDRKHLVEAACKSRDFFAYLCKYTTFDPSDSNRMALFAAFAIESLERARGPELSENIAPTLLSHLVPCLRDQHPAAQHTACAVAVALCQIAHLANDAALAMCMLLLRRAATADHHKHLLEAALVVFELQSARDSSLPVPEKAVPLLQTTPELVSALCEAEGMHDSQFVSKLAFLLIDHAHIFQVLSEHIKVHDAERARTLSRLILTPPLRKHHGVAVLARRIMTGYPDVFREVGANTPFDFFEFCFPPDAPSLTEFRLYLVPLAPELPSLWACLGDAKPDTRLLALRKLDALRDTSVVANVLFEKPGALGPMLAEDGRYSAVCQAVLALAVKLSSAAARPAALQHLRNPSTPIELGNVCLDLLVALLSEAQEDVEGCVAACAYAYSCSQAGRRKEEKKAMEVAGKLMPRFWGSKSKAAPQRDRDVTLLDALSVANPPLALELMGRDLNNFAPRVLQVATASDCLPTSPEGLVSALGARAVVTHLLCHSSKLQGPLDKLLSCALKAWGANLASLVGHANEQCATRALQLLRSYLRGGNKVTSLELYLLPALTSESPLVRAEALKIAELSSASSPMLRLAWEAKIEVERDSQAMFRLVLSLPENFADKLRADSVVTFAALLTLAPLRPAVAQRAVDWVLSLANSELTQEEQAVLKKALPVVIAQTETDDVFVKALSKSRAVALEALQSKASANPNLATPRVLDLVADCSSVVSAMRFSAQAMVKALAKALDVQDWDKVSALLSSVVAQHTSHLLIEPSLRSAREARKAGRLVTEHVALSALERCLAAASPDVDLRKVKSELIATVLDTATPEPSRWFCLEALCAARPSASECEALFHHFGRFDSSWGTMQRLEVLPVAPELLCRALLKARPQDAARVAKSLAALPKAAVAVRAWLAAGGDVAPAALVLRPLSLSETTGVLAALVRTESPPADFIAEHLGGREYLRKAALTASAGDTESFVDLVHALLQALAISPESSALERALDIVTTLLQLPLFCSMVLEVCNHDDVVVQGLGLRMLRKVDEEHNGWTRGETALVLDMVPQLVSRLGESHARETSVLALNALARCLAAKHPHVFAPVVTALVDAVVKDESLLGAACLCWGELCEPLGTRLLGMMEQIMPHVLKGAADDDETVRSVALQALVSVVTAVGSGVGPWLDALVAVEDDGVLGCLASQVEPRQALQAAKRCVCDSSDVIHVRGVRLMGLVVDRAGLAAQLLPEAAISLLQHARPGHEDEDADVLLRMALQLSEGELEALLGSMIQMEDKRASLLLFVLMLQARFGALFVPLFPMDLVLTTIKSAQSPAADSNGKPKKRAKLDGAAISSAAYSLEVRRALLALAEFFVHATALPKEQTMACLAALLVVLRLPVDFDQAMHVGVPAISGLATAAGPAEWQTLVHAVVKEAKAKVASTRRCATAALVSMFSNVGAELLVVMPDVLGTLAELLEDTDKGVVEQAQALVRVLQQLSGEDIVKLLAG